MTTNPEEALIGAILCDDIVALDACHRIGVHEDWFASNACRIAWLYIIHLKKKGSGVDAFLLYQASKKNHGELLAVPVTTKWQDAAITPAYAANYAEQVRNEYKRRTATFVANRLLEEIKDNGDPEAIISETQYKLNELNVTIEKRKTIEEIYAEIIERYRLAAEKQSCGMPLAWPELNELIGGYQAGEGPYIIAARPGVGKSTFMVNDAMFQVKQGIPVSISSQEMSENKLRARALCSDADFSTFSLDYGNGCDYHFNRLEEISKIHAKLPLRIQDRPQTIEQFCSWATNEILKYGARLIYLDYLQILLSSRRHASRNEEVSEWMRAIRHLDKQFKTVPFVVLSQLRRPHESQIGERPTLRDLRDSGSIEQDAAAVMFIHDNNIEHECGFDKNRFGPTGWRKLWFNKSRQRFESISGIPANPVPQ